MNTGMKAPEGMGIVVETADIQNCDTKMGSRWYWPTSRGFFFLPPHCHATANSVQQALWRMRYLHDKEEDQDDEDADMWMEPRSRATQAGRRGILGDFGPGEIIKKGVYTLPWHQLWKKKWELPCKNKLDNS